MNRALRAWRLCDVAVYTRPGNFILVEQAKQTRDGLWIGRALCPKVRAAQYVLYLVLRDLRDLLTGSTEVAVSLGWNPEPLQEVTPLRRAIQWKVYVNMMLNIPAACYSSWYRGIVRLFETCLCQVRSRGCCWLCYSVMLELTASQVFVCMYVIV